MKNNDWAGSTVESMLISTLHVKRNVEPPETREIVACLVKQAYKKNGAFR